MEYTIDQEEIDLKTAEEEWKIYCRIHNKMLMLNTLIHEDKPYTTRDLEKEDKEFKEQLDATIKLIKGTDIDIDTLTDDKIKLFGSAYLALEQENLQYQSPPQVPYIIGKNK